jgi:hypothetical protein
VEDWIDAYAEALDLPPLSAEEVDVLLTLASDVAHGSVRRFAPLATFLAGFHAGTRSGTDTRRDAITEAATTARLLLDDDEEDRS